MATIPMVGRAYPLLNRVVLVAVVVTASG